MPRTNAKYTAMMTQSMVVNRIRPHLLNLNSPELMYSLRSGQSHSHRKVASYSNCLLNSRNCCLRSAISF